MDKIFPILLAIAFPALWATVLLLLSHMGGWSRLARYYPDDIAAKNELIKASYLQSGAVGLVNYNSCLILGVSKSGLRMSVLLPFRIAHPPIFIPWSEFRDITEKRTLFLSFLVAKHRNTGCYQRNVAAVDSRLHSCSTGQSLIILASLTSPTRRLALRAYTDQVQADVWVLTETHDSFTPGYAFSCSSAEGSDGNHTPVPLKGLSDHFGVAVSLVPG